MPGPFRKSSASGINGTTPTVQRTISWTDGSVPEKNRWLSEREMSLFGFLGRRRITSRNKVSPPDLISCQAPGCPEPSVLHISHFEEGRFCGVEHLCRSHGEQYHKLAALTRHTSGGRKPAEDEVVPVVLRCIAFLDGRSTTLIILRENAGRRLFLLPGDYYTSAAISQSTQQSGRPGSHRVMAMLLEACAASLLEVMVDSCDSGGVYHTQVSIRANARVQTLDLRPSDALSLSHTCRVPFLVRARLLYDSPHDLDLELGQQPPGFHVPQFEPQDPKTFGRLDW